MRDSMTWTNHLESRDRGMVADLLKENCGAIIECGLPSLPKNGVKRLAPGLENMLQACHKPGKETTEAMSVIRELKACL